MVEFEVVEKTTNDGKSYYILEEKADTSFDVDAISRSAYTVSNVKVKDYYGTD